MSGIKPDKPAMTSPGGELDEHSKLIIQVRTLMKTREEARKASDFGKSDSLRERLAGMGVEVKDQLAGPSGWRFVDGRSSKLPAGTKQTQVPKEAQKIRDRTVVPDDAKGQKGQKGQQLKGKEGDKKRAREGEAGGAASKDKHKDGADGEAQAKKARADAPPKKVAPTPDELRNKAALTQVMGKGGKGRDVQGVYVEDLVEGKGRVAEAGKKIKMGYVGRLKSTGKVFDASGQKPFVFRLGRAEVIKGWDIGAWCCPSYSLHLPFVPLL